MIPRSLLCLHHSRKQSPHCDSINKDRLIFSPIPKNGIFHPVVKQKDGKDTYDLRLGQSHLVHLNDMFLIFENANFESAPIGEGKVIKSFDFNSWVECQFDTSLRHAFAVRVIPTQPISMVVATHTDWFKYEWSRNLGVGLLRDGEGLLNIEHGTGEDDDQCWMKFRFGNRKSHPLEATLFHPWPLEDYAFLQILEQIGHFFHYLDLMPESSSPVEVKMFRVE